MGKSKRRKRARAARARAAAIRELEKHLSDWTHDNVEMAGKVRLAEKEVTALRESVSRLEAERDESRDAVVRLFFGLARQYDWTVKDRDGRLREFNMWRSAWLREIGGVIRHKHHEIDGFVLRTRDIYEHWQKTQGLEAANAKLTAERDHYRILRDAASESSLRREADCLAIRTERDRWKQAFEKLVIKYKYNLPVRLG